MIESGCGLGLSQQRLFSTLTGAFCGEELNSYFPAERLVLSQVDLAMPPHPELRCATIVVTNLRRVNVLRAKKLSTRHPVRSQEAPADQGAEMSVRFSLPRQQSPELFHPCLTANSQRKD